MTKHSASAARFEGDVIPLLEPLYLHAIRLTSNRADAEDLVQETVLKAYMARNSFRPGTNFRAWLYRIMTHTYIDSYRKLRRRPTQYSSDEITDRQLAANAARTLAGPLSAEDRALEMLPDPQINAAMMSLHEKFRIAVYLADVAGFSCKEIAVITGTELGTVRSRLNRGRRQLRRLLTDVPSNFSGGQMTASPATPTSPASRGRRSAASCCALDRH